MQFLSLSIWISLNKVQNKSRIWQQDFDFERKKVRGFFWAIGIPKKNKKISKNIEKTPYNDTEELHKKGYNFSPGATNHTFLLTLYIIYSGRRLYQYNEERRLLI